MWVRSLGREDPSEEGMETHSSILAWRIPMDRGAWWARVHGVAKSRTRLKQLKTHALTNDHHTDFFCLCFSHGEVQLHNLFCISELEFFQDFPGGPGDCDFASNAEGACRTPAQGTRIPHALMTKTTEV